MCHRVGHGSDNASDEEQSCRGVQATSWLTEPPGYKPRPVGSEVRCCDLPQLKVEECDAYSNVGETEERCESAIAGESVGGPLGDPQGKVGRLPAFDLLKPMSRRHGMIDRSAEEQKRISAVYMFPCAATSSSRARSQRSRRFAPRAASRGGCQWRWRTGRKRAVSSRLCVRRSLSTRGSCIRISLQLVGAH